MKNFKIPAQWLKQGEKIRLPYWQEGSYWVLSKDGYDRILYSDGSNAVVHIEQLQNNEWEKVKSIDKETLIKLLKLCPKEITKEDINKISEILWK